MPAAILAAGLATVALASAAVEHAEDSSSWPIIATGGVVVALAAVAVFILARVFGASLRSMSLRSESERLINPAVDRVT